VVVAAREEEETARTLRKEAVVKVFMLSV